MHRIFLALLLAVLLVSPVFAQLPQMPAVEAETQPAQEEITYDSWFLKTLVLRADNEKAWGRLIFVRYNYENKIASDDPEDQRVVEFADAYTLASEYTVWQEVMGAIVQCAALAVQEDELESQIAHLDAQIEAAGEGEDTSTLEAEKAALQGSLDSVHQSMGPIE